MISIRVERLKGKAYPGIDMLVVDELKARHHVEYMFDSAKGTYVWTHEDPDCSTTVMEVFSGHAMIRRFKDLDDYTDFSRSLLLVKRDADGVKAGFIMKQKSRICGVQCYTSQLTSVFICVNTPMGTNKISQHEMMSVPKHLDESTNVLSGLSYLFITMKLELFERFEQISERMCDIETATLKNKLSLLTGPTKEHALMELYGQGHTSIVAGSVAYISRCKEKEATLAPQKNCTQEIPVHVGESEEVLYADPFTFILKKYATFVPCSSVLSVRWAIGDKFMCATPSVVRCSAPAQLGFNETKDIFNGTVTLDGIGGGLLPGAEWANANRFRDMEDARNPVLAHLVNEVSNGHPDPNHPFKSLASFSKMYLPGLDFLGAYPIHIGTIIVMSSVLLMLVIMMRRICKMKKQGTPITIARVLFGAPLAEDDFNRHYGDRMAMRLVGRMMDERENERLNPRGNMV